VNSWSRAGLAICGTALLIITAAAAERKPRWENFASTYNSQAFLDRASVVESGQVREVRVLRVSARPTADGWSTVHQSVRVDCARQRFTDLGSTIETPDRRRVTYPATPAYRGPPLPPLFGSLLRAVCTRHKGTAVTDPVAWTRARISAR
jgi:hypothetical protein